MPGEVAVSEKPKPVDPGNKPEPNSEIDEFFQRLPANFRWPKPNAEAVAAAVEAIQRMSGGTAPDLPSVEQPGSENTCASCGGSLPAGARFCVWCGLAKDTSAGAPTSAGSAGAQHHVHHHYHHVVSAQGAAAASPAAAPDSAAARGRAPGSSNPAPGGRAEISARQVVQDWAQACNTRHIDDLLELYTADATVIRSSIPPVRSLPAIREFLASMLEAGLGDVEMDSLRLEVMGEIAMDIGRCKMLVPVAMGKRREERGKYLVVLVRQPVGTWKILADCWSADLPVSAPPAQEAAARKANEPVAPPRKPR
jgi:ketosteroid isomerase-like protein